MAKLSIQRATASKLVYLRAVSGSTGNGLTGLTYNTSGLACAYHVEGQAPVVVPLVAATRGVWVSGGFVEVDPTNFPGLYELGLPNAALASGASVRVILRGAAAMLDSAAEVALTGVNDQDGVHYGLSALPNVAAGAAGGLPTATNAAGSGAVAALLVAADGSTNLNMAQTIPTAPQPSTVGRFLRSVKARLLGVAPAPSGNQETFLDDGGATALVMSYDNITAPTQRTAVSER